MSQETRIKMVCESCKRNIINTTKNKKSSSEKAKTRLELKKFCKFCRTHKLHKETK